MGRCLSKKFPQKCVSWSSISCWIKGESRSNQQVMSLTCVLLPRVCLFGSLLVFSVTHLTGKSEWTVLLERACGTRTHTGHKMNSCCLVVLLSSEKRRLNKRESGLQLEFHLLPKSSFIPSHLPPPGFPRSKLKPLRPLKVFFFYKKEAILTITILKRNLFFGVTQFLGCRTPSWNSFKQTFPLLIPWPELAVYSKCPTEE